MRVTNIQPNHGGGITVPGGSMLAPGASVDLNVEAIKPAQMRSLVRQHESKKVRLDFTGQEEALLAQRLSQAGLARPVAQNMQAGPVIVSPPSTQAPAPVQLRTGTDLTPNDPPPPPAGD